MNTTAVCEYVPCARRCDPSRPHRAVLVFLAIGTSDALAAASRGIARRLKAKARLVEGGCVCESWEACEVLCGSGK